jgi:hypothetical protein
VDAYGTAHLEDGSVVAVHSAEDWAWIEHARRTGTRFVLSCSDRFPHPPEYFPAYAADEDELARTKASLSAPMTEVLCVYDLRPEERRVRRRRWWSRR